MKNIVDAALVGMGLGFAFLIDTHTISAAGAVAAGVFVVVIAALGIYDATRPADEDLRPRTF